VGSLAQSHIGNEKILKKSYPQNFCDCGLFCHCFLIWDGFPIWEFGIVDGIAVLCPMTKTTAIMYHLKSLSDTVLTAHEDLEQQLALGSIDHKTFLRKQRALWKAFSLLKPYAKATEVRAMKADQGNYVTLPLN
jgi:hypothetical protein